MEELLKHVRFFYTKFGHRCGEDVVHISAPHTFFQQFVRHLWERYELKDVALQKCKEVLCATSVSWDRDERVDYFASFLGIKEEKCPVETPALYMKLLQSTDIPLETVCGKDWNVIMNFSDALSSMKRYHTLNHVSG